MGYALVVAFVLVSSDAQAGGTQVQRQDNILGKQLFEGLVMVPAKMSGHSVALPAEASRCSNCHANASAMRSTDVALGQTRAFATPLNQTTLNTVFARRGGPASRYDSLSFCKVVREGIDPRQVVINK